MITVFSDKHPISLTGKEYTFDVENDKVTDSYHSMAELYDVRRALTVALFDCLHSLGGSVYKSKLHNDGTLFEGYFIVAANLQEIPSNKYISFHYELEHWDKFKIPEIERIPWVYDGHTTKDVIERLES